MSFTKEEQEVVDLFVPAIKATLDEVEKAKLSKLSKALVIRAVYMGFGDTIALTLRLKEEKNEEI